MQQRSTTSAPLAGMRVVEFGQYIAVPAAAQTLADLGADVIKVEPPTGDASRGVGWTADAYSPMFTSCNRGKRSVILDLRSTQHRSLAYRLACRSDILLQNMRPGVMERLGLGEAQLREAAPRLIYGQVSGFGRCGPASSRPGFDIAAQAESGMMSLNGPSDGDPTRVGFAAVDSMAAHALTCGVLGALVRRGATGEGAVVDVSLIDVAIEALGFAWAEYALTGVVPTRCGNGQPFTAPAADLITTANGSVVVSAYTQEHFARLCAAIGRPELSNDERFRENSDRVRNRAALLRLLSAALKDKSSDQICALLTEAGVVVGAVKSMSEILPGRGGVSEDLFINVSARGRQDTKIPGLPFTIDSHGRRNAKLPALGEHTQEVLAELAMP